MGIFSGSKTVNRGYDIVPLKDNVKLQDDLWKNSKLRMNKAFMDGGVNAYNKLSHNMYKKIRKKFSTSYLKKAGVITDNTFSMLEFDTERLQQYLIIASGDPSMTLSNYQVNEVTPSYSSLQNILGSLVKVECSLVDEDDVYYNFTIVGGEVVEAPVMGTSVNRTMILIECLNDRSYSSREVPLSIQYEKLETANVTGLMYPKDMFNYMKKNQSELWYWLSNPKDLVGTISYDSLRVSYQVSSVDLIETTITDNATSTTTNLGLANNISKAFNVSVFLTGKAKAIDDDITVTTEEVDSDIVPDNTITSNTESSTEDGFYNTSDPITETNTTSLGDFSASYSIIGDRITHVTTKIEETYLPGSRTNKEGNVIKTYVKTTTTTIITECEPSNYSIEVEVTQPIVTCYPKLSYVIKPVITTDAYSNYVALNTKKISIREFINNHTIQVASMDYNIFSYDDPDSTTISLKNTPEDMNKVEQILIQKGAIVHEDGWGYTSVVGPLVSYHEANHFKFNVGLFFNKSSQEALNLDIITLCGHNENNDYIKVSIEVKDDMYSTSENHLLTPVIPLRYADSVLYSRSKDGKAIKYTIDNLKNIITSINQYRNYLDPYEMKWINDYPRDNKENDIKTIQDIVETITGSVSEVHSIVEDNEATLKEITEAIVDKNPPNIDDILTQLSSSDNFEKADNKTKKLQHILDPMGIPVEGFDDLIDTVSTNNDIYTAAIISGLRLFNEDNTLITDSTNARAKVLHLFADSMTTKSIILDTPQTFSISNYIINATYTYTVEKSIITDFKTTNEYTLATEGSKLNNKYFMRTSYEVVKTIDDGYNIWNIKNQIIYTYKINRDGSATRFKFISIDMNLTSYDGKYKISTCDSYELDPWYDTIEVTSRTNLHKLIIVYPESINKKLSFHEYSNLYNDNLFLFVYSRKVTHTKWYQSSFFGFVLMVAVITVMALTAQPEFASTALGSLISSSPNIATAIEVGVFGYGMGITFTNMPIAMRIAVTIAMTYATRGINSGSITSASTSEAATTITMESVIESIENYFTNMSTMDMVTFTTDKLKTAYSIYIKEKLESEADNARKFIAAATEATEKLDDKLKEFDIQKERVSIFASFMLDFIEAETYNQLAVSEMYMSNEFNASLLDYISSTEYQSDIAKIPNLPTTDVMV